MRYADSLGEVKFIETRTFLDKLIGGVPRGRLGEVFGDESMGKSTLCLQIVAEAQKQGLKCVWVDIEHSFEPLYAARLGVDLKKLGLIEDEVAEDSLNELEKEAEKGKWDLIILDSVGAMRTQAQAEKSYGEKTIGSQASLMSTFAKNMAVLARYRGFALIGINHSFVDLMSGQIQTSGGKKWRYFKSWSIRLKSGGKVIKSGEEVIGKVINARVEKDKIGGNEKAEVEATIMFKEGFSKSTDLLDEAQRKGVITRTGNSFFLGETKLGTISKVREWLKIPENADHLKELLTKI